MGPHKIAKLLIGVKMRQEDSMIVCLKDDGVVRINEQHRLLIDISP